MKADLIIKIEIDDLGRLRIYPEQEKFALIYRSATEVHWDNDGYLYSPKPREWSYLDWYKHIVSVIKVECNQALLLSENTLFINVPAPLKQDIQQFKL